VSTHADLAKDYEEVGSPVFGGDMVPLGIHGLVAGMEPILGNGLNDEVLIVLGKVPAELLGRSSQLFTPLC
jgi:hypothetical protein